jgi:HD-like signal output (HDOD) protein/DNA-binding NarL/FixJ family response regulator
MMHRVLVVDDMPIFREPIAASIRRAGYVTFSAADGKEALALVQKEKPDLVLLDVAMPVMNGLECLKALRANPETRNIPVIMLTAMAEREPIAEALKIGIQGYLLKSQFSLEDMLARIAKTLDKQGIEAKEPQEAATRDSSEAAPQAKREPQSQSVASAAGAKPAPAQESAPRPSMGRSTTMAHVHKKLELQAVPPVLRSVMAMVNSSESSIDQIAATVRQDPALAMRVLKIANSSLFGSGRQVQSLSEATQRIGLAGVRSTVAAILAIEHFSTSKTGGINPQRFWEHSVATAVLAQLLGQTLHEADCEHFFLAGLLHDIGRLILCNALPQEYEAVLQHAASERCDVSVAEKEAFGLTHIDVTREALTKLETPELVRQAIQLHESELPQIERAARMPRDAIIVALANRLAHAGLMGESGNSRLMPFHDYAAALGLSGEALHSVVREAVDKTSEMSMFYASQGRDSMGKLFSAELAASVECPVRVAVFATDAPGDPMSLFFEQLGWLDRAEPDVAVFYVTKDAKPMRCWDDLQAFEKGIGRQLSVLTASPGGSVSPPAEEMNGRQSGTIAVPCFYSDLLGAVTSPGTVTATSAGASA